MRGKWLRGNLHAHTTLSDGAQTMEELITDYQGRGYDFLAVTDHDLIAPLARFRADTSLLLIPGTEITASGPHICAIGAQTEIRPYPDRQKSIDAARVQDALVVLNHPNWQTEYAHWPQEEMERLTGYDAIEIFNGITQYHIGSPVATDRWDRLLSAGRHVWGLANDDTHFTGGVASGWNMVRLPKDAPVTWPALRKAIRKGDFYATTGVTLKDVAWHGKTLRVVSENADRIRFFGTYGHLLASEDAAEASFTPDAAEPYVRAEAYGPRGTVAWTQPVFPAHRPL